MFTTNLQLIKNQSYFKFITNFRQSFLLAALCTVAASGFFLSVSAVNTPQTVVQEVVQKKAKEYQGGDFDYCVNYLLVGHNLLCYFSRVESFQQNDVQECLKSLVGEKLAEPTLFSLAFNWTNAENMDQQALEVAICRIQAFREAGLLEGKPFLDKIFDHFIKKEYAQYWESLLESYKQYCSIFKFHDSYDLFRVFRSQWRIIREETGFDIMRGYYDSVIEKMSLHGNATPIRISEDDTFCDFKLLLNGVAEAGRFTDLMSMTENDEIWIHISQGEVVKGRLASSCEQALMTYHAGRLSANFRNDMMQSAVASDMRLFDDNIAHATKKIDSEAAQIACLPNGVLTLRDVILEQLHSRKIPGASRQHLSSRMCFLSKRLANKKSENGENLVVGEAKIMFPMEMFKEIDNFLFDNRAVRSICEIKGPKLRSFIFNEYRSLCKRQESQLSPHSTVVSKWADNSFEYQLDFLVKDFLKRHDLVQETTEE